MATPSEVTIVSYPGNLGGSLNVPATINGLPVTSIGSKAFYNCQYLTSVTLPASLKTLSGSAFARCSGLTSFTIPASVVSIDGNVFEGCSKLASINVSSSNPNYASSDGILYNKNRTTLITLPEYKSGAIVLPSGLTSIRSFSTSNCSRITSVSIPASVTSIQSSFPYGRSLERIDVDPANPSYSSRDGMLYNKDFSTLIRVPGAKSGQVVVEDGTSIGGAFTGAYAVEEVVLPASVTVISDFMFADCESLRTMELPPGLTGIGQFAFVRCYALSEMIIPEGVQTIGKYAFRSCRSLVRVRLPSSLTVLPQECFGSCESLAAIDLPPGLVRIEDDAFSNAHGLSEVIIPESVEFIGARAFFVTGLRTVRIPAGVRSIGVIAFSACRELLEIQVDPQNPYYTTFDGVLYSKDLRTLLQCPAGKSGVVTVPDSVTTIPMNAFSQCASITAIRFMGDSPTWGASGGITPQILYFDGRVGFGSATWNGFPATHDGQPRATGLWLVSHRLPYDRDLADEVGGVPLLVSYALGLDPDVHAAASLPRAEIAPDSISLRYFAGRPDIAYVPQRATTLGDWSSEGIAISEPDGEGFRTARCPRGGETQFMRLDVRSAVD